MVERNIKKAIDSVKTHDYLQYRPDFDKLYPSIYSLACQDRQGPSKKNLYTGTVGILSIIGVTVSVLWQFIDLID